MISSGRLIYAFGRIPLVGFILRKLARKYEEGSVVTISRGYAKGLRWKRYHRYVSGYWLGIYEPELQAAFSSILQRVLLV